MVFYYSGLNGLRHLGSNKMTLVTGGFDFMSRYKLKKASSFEWENKSLLNIPLHIRY